MPPPNPPPLKEPPSAQEPQPKRRYRAPAGPPGHVDFPLLNIILILVAVGLVSVFSASAHVAQAQMGDALHFVKRQMFGAALGLVALLLALRIDVYKLPQWIKPLMYVTIVLLACTHLPGIGVTAKGSSRWVNLFGFVFQPSEIAKPILVLYLSSILGHPYYSRFSLKERAELMGPVGAILALVLFQPDLGTTIAIGSAVVVLYFVAGLAYWKFGALMGAAATGVLLLSWATPYQRARITSWLDPWSDPQGTGYHLIQSMIAIGSGGFMGNGFGQSIQKLFYLPEQHTDFIFAVISEEFGFLGVLTLLGIFVWLAQRGVTIGFRSPTPYLKLMSIGLVSMVVSQAFINLAVVSGTIPTTGITLPFISFGSSSLIVNMAAMGLLLNVSRYMIRPSQPAAPPAAPPT
jgi:cell division protein FtsW